MELVPNQTYRFVFEDPFSSLGYTSEVPTQGFYTLLEITSYERLLELGIDLVEELYSPVGLTEADLTSAASSYAGMTFYRLRSVVNTDTIICMPSSKIVQAPRSDVDSYPNVVVAVNLGPIADTDILSNIAALLQDSIAFLYGIETTAKWGSFGLLWMLHDEYLARASDREEIKTASTIPSVLGDEDTQIPFNVIAENQQLRNANAALQARIDALEETLVVLSGGE